MKARQTLWDRRGGLILNTLAQGQLEEWGLSSVEGADSFALGEELRRYPEKSIVRFEHGGVRYFLKRYHYSRALFFIRSLLKFNFPVFSGPIELKRLEQLENSGFRVPEALAAGIGGTLFRGLSFIVLKELSGQSLEDLVQSPKLGAISLRRQRERAKSLGLWIRRFHDAGFCHKDLYLCHLFLNDKNEWGLLDCERVVHRQTAVPRRWIIKDLAALYYSSKGVERSCRLSFLAGYFGKLSASSLRMLAKVERKAERLARKGRKV
jgi:heptose I phosphotransferase